MTNTIFEIGGLTFKGNVVDHEWFNYITFSNGKPHIVAIMILSEIVYWYRPSVIRDEESGKVTYKKKFKSDKLQKSYQQLAETFGFTKLQVKRACDLLTEMTLIKVEFRTIHVEGKVLNNVMFVEPVANEIKLISSMYQNTEVPGYFEVKSPITPKSSPSLLKSKDSPNLEVKTNTEITTENTTKNVSSSNIFSFYENNFGILNPFVADSITQWANDTSEELVQASMERALKQQKKWNYAEGILKQWVNKNIRTLADVHASETEYKNKGKKGAKNNASNQKDSSFIDKYDFKKH